MQLSKTFQKLVDYHIKVNEENRALERKKYYDGFIPTDSKLIVLEASAYRKTLVNEDASQELELMESLRESEKLAFIHQKENTVIYSRLLSMLKTVFFATVFCTLIVIPTKKNCFENNLKSDYCQIVRNHVEFYAGKKSL